MKNNKIVTIVLILILLVTISTLSPILQKMPGQKISPTEAPQIIVAPKTYQFDRSTDLKKELNSINPAVLDSDFE